MRPGPRAAGGGGPSLLGHPPAPHHPPNMPPPPGPPLMSPFGVPIFPPGAGAPTFGQAGGFMPAGPPMLPLGHPHPGGGGLPHPMAGAPFAGPPVSGGGGTQFYPQYSQPDLLAAPGASHDQATSRKSKVSTEKLHLFLCVCSVIWGSTFPLLFLYVYI